MKYIERDVNKKLNYKDIEFYLNPIKDYIEEKKNLNIYDDFNEYENSLKIIDYINEKLIAKDCVTIYRVEDNESTVAILMIIKDKQYLEKNLGFECNDTDCILTSFYVLKSYRGLGGKWLENYVFKSLKKKGTKNIYVKSSHYKAFNFYERLGVKTGEYTFLSDNKMYVRLGNIYKIEL